MQLMPVKGLPMSSRTTPVWQWTSPRPAKGVSRQPARLWPSNNRCQPSPSKGAGGWGGSLVGISSLEGMDASENETTKFVNFESGRWYRIRLRVTEKRIEGWIDKEKLVDVQTTDRKISVRPGDIELSQPFGLAAWQTAAAFREIKFRRVSGPARKGE